MKVVSFGVGKFYQKREHIIKSNAELVAFIDNNPELHGKEMDGVPVRAPGDVNQFSYDKILLMSMDNNQMKKQLLSLGIEENKIWYWEQFNSMVFHGTFKFHYGKNAKETGKKRILIISTALEYNGGSWAAAYAAIALQKRENFVVLAAPYGNAQFIDEIVELGVHVVICPALHDMYQEEYFFVRQFDFVVVNTFQMIACACEISKIRPVLWWIHEPKELYEYYTFRYGQYMNFNKMSELNICAVSPIAQANFNEYLPGRIKKTLVYGIPDEGVVSRDRANDKKIVFAVIGIMNFRKAQDIFINAIRKLEKVDKEKAEFWIIGAVREDGYNNRVFEMASKEPSVKIWGELTRSMLNCLYQDIDVIVCPSREEPMSLIVTEGMMYGKICIVSDTVGMANYILEGENGFICKSEDITSFSERMKWVIHNQDIFEKVGLKARKTYDSFFTLDGLGERLEQLID